MKIAVFQKHGFIVSNKVNNKYYYGYINYLGEKLLDTKYSEIIRIQDTNSKDDIYLIANSDVKSSFYKNKKEIIKSDYEDIQYDIANKKLILQKNQKQGLADLNGKIIIPIEYDNIIVAGSCINAQKNGEVILFKPDGAKIQNNNLISMFQTENEKFIICVNNEEKYGIIDNNENQIIENKYFFLSYLWEDYFIAKNENYFGIINSSNEIILNFEYDSLQKVEQTNIIEGLKNNKKIYLNKNLKQIKEFEDIKRKMDNNYLKLYSITQKELMYLDKDGNIIENIDYLNTKLFAKEENGKWGFINKAGEFIVDAKFDYVTEFNKYGFAGIMKDEKWGVIDEAGTVIEEPKYKFDDEELPTFIGKYYETYLGYGEKFYKDESEI